MCGRYTSTTSAQDLAAYFDAVDLAEGVLDHAIGPRWNVAPTDEVWAVAAPAGPRQLGRARWGLVPPWADSPKVGGRMINARAETLADRPAWRRPFATGRRCLIAADGFYEWRAGRAFYAHRPDGAVLAFAGLWETWRGRRVSDEGWGPPERDVLSCAIVTTTAGADMAPVHDRMPAVLTPDAWDDWLDPANGDLAGLTALLGPLPPGALELTPVGPRVGNVANDGPDLIEPVPAEAPAVRPLELFPEG